MVDVREGERESASRKKKKKPSLAFTKMTDSHSPPEPDTPASGCVLVELRRTTTGEDAFSGESNTVSTSVRGPRVWKLMAGTAAPGTPQPVTNAVETFITPAKQLLSVWPKKEADPTDTTRRIEEECDGIRASDTLLF